MRQCDKVLTLIGVKMEFWHNKVYVTLICQSTMLWQLWRVPSSASRQCCGSCGVCPALPVDNVLAVVACAHLCQSTMFWQLWRVPSSAYTMLCYKYTFQTLLCLAVRKLLSKTIWQGSRDVKLFSAEVYWILLYKILRNPSCLVRSTIMNVKRMTIFLLKNFFLVIFSINLSFAF